MTNYKQNHLAISHKVYRDSETHCIVGRNMGRLLCSLYDSRTQRLYLCVRSTAPSLDILLFAINLMAWWWLWFQNSCSMHKPENQMSLGFFQNKFGGYQHEQTNLHNFKAKRSCRTSKIKKVVKKEGALIFFCDKISRRHIDPIFLIVTKQKPNILKLNWQEIQDLIYTENNTYLKWCWCRHYLLK